jgi:ribosomal protein S24E
MELAIKDKKENHALLRQELTCALSYEKAMPSRKQIREALIAATGADPALLVIVSAKGGFGTNQAIVRARVYKDKNAAAVERGYLLVRDGLAEKKAKAKKKAAPVKK